VHTSRRLIQEHSAYATLYREGHRYYARGDGWGRMIREHRISVSDSISSKNNMKIEILLCALIAGGSRAPEAVRAV
jgi:hypothetical protein